MGGWSRVSESAPPLQFVRMAADRCCPGDLFGFLRCRLTMAEEQRQRPGRSARLLTVEGVPVPGRIEPPGAPVPVSNLITQFEESYRQDLWISDQNQLIVSFRRRANLALFVAFARQVSSA